MRCDSDRAWACALLHTLSPQLEELEMLEVQEEHVRVLPMMPRLRMLSLQTKTSSASALLARFISLPASLEKLEVS